MKTIHKTIGFVDRHVEKAVIVLAIVRLVQVCSWTCAGIRWIGDLI